MTCTTFLLRALAPTLATALLATTAHAQADQPSAEQRACLVAKFEQAHAIMTGASKRSTELFKSRFPDKAGLLDAMQDVEATLRDGSVIVFRHLIATDPSKLNLREGMGIEVAVPLFSIETELKTLAANDSQAQALLDRAEAASKTLDSNEASVAWYREEALPAVEADMIAIQTEAQAQLSELNTQDCGWPATGAAALSDTRRQCMVHAVKAQSAAQVEAEQATATLWTKALPEQAALIAAERDRKIAEAEIAAIEFAQAATTAPARLLISPDAEELSQFQSLMPLEIEAVRIDLESKDPAYAEAKERRRAAERDATKLGGARRLSYLISEAQAKGLAMDDALFQADQEAGQKAYTAGAAKCPR